MLGRASFGRKFEGFWLGVLALVRSGASWVEKFCASFWQMCGNLWIIPRLWLGDYEKLRGNLISLVVFV